MGGVRSYRCSDLARHFFTCKIFHNLERPIIIAAMKLKDMDRIIGDDVLKYRPFKFQKNDTVLLFGSSMLIPKDNPSGQEEIYKKEPKELYVEAARTLPEKGSSFVSQARSVVVNTSVSLLISLHKMYSKYLLVSTYNKILSEE